MFPDFSFERTYKQVSCYKTNRYEEETSIGILLAVTYLSSTQIKETAEIIGYYTDSAAAWC
jgi:hypothetical protein